MSFSLSKPRRAIWVVMSACLFVLAITAPRAAHADKVDRLIDKLVNSPDYKVRLSAALNLAKVSDTRAIRAFLRALSDSDKTVRGVAAASLGKIVDASVPEGRRAQVQTALRRSASKDSNSFVRRQAQKAYDALKSLDEVSSSGGGGGIFVDIGPMSSKAQGSEEFRSTMRKSIQGTFKKKGKTMLIDWPGGKTPSKKQLSSKKMSAFHVDGTLTELSAVATGSVTNVSCKISMLLATYPDKSMFGFLKGGAKVQAGTSDRDIQYAKEDCVVAVVEDLIGRKVIPTIKARAQ